jgi:competence protein ComEA
MNADDQRDWTTGPAKLVAVIVLGGASIAGMMWSMLTREPASARAGVALAVPRSDEDARGRDVEGAATERPSAGRAGSIVRLINLNTATAQELELLPGIGPALAQRIVDHRESRGAFRSLNDLDRVSGIGPRTIERLRDKVTVE